MNVMEEIFKLQTALTQLGLSLDAKGGKDSHFQAYLRNLFSAQLQTNFPLLAVELELRRMWTFIGQLRELRQYRPDVFKRCIKQLNQNTAEKNFWGYRFEIHIAHQLLCKNIGFTYREKPDFSLKHKGADIYIECGSRRPDKPLSTLDLAKKALFSPTGTINAKAAAPYMNLKTALFVDVTNLIFNAANNNTPLDLLDIESEIDGMVDQTNCGAIAVVVFGQNNETARVGCITSVFYNVKIDTNLRDLLMSLYPRMEKRTLNISVFGNT